MLIVTPSVWAPACVQPGPHAIVLTVAECSCNDLYPFLRAFEDATLLDMAFKIRIELTRASKREHHKRFQSRWPSIRSAVTERKSSVVICVALCVY